MSDNYNKSAEDNRAVTVVLDANSKLAAMSAAEIDHDARPSG